MSVLRMSLHRPRWCFSGGSRCERQWVGLCMWLNNVQSASLRYSACQIVEENRCRPSACTRFVERQSCTQLHALNITCLIQLSWLLVPFNICTSLAAQNCECCHFSLWMTSVQWHLQLFSCFMTPFQWTSVVWHDVHQTDAPVVSLTHCGVMHIDQHAGGCRIILLMMWSSS